MYTLDTNAVVYYLAGEEALVGLIAKTQEDNDVLYVPTIVRLELLSKPDMSLKEYHAIVSFLDACRYVNLDIAVSDIAADIRRLHRLKTPDSIIAASALYTGTTLVTRNVRDFDKVTGLAVLGV